MPIASHIRLLPALTLFLGGCNTVFDYSAPDIDFTRVHSMSDAVDAADELRFGFYEKHASLVNSLQFFDIPIIASAITAAAALAFGAHKDFALIASVTGGTFAVARTYYNPRARGDIYQRGVDAVSCITNVALTLPSTPAVPSNDAPPPAGDENEGNPDIVSNQNAPISADPRLRSGLDSAISTRTLIENTLASASQQDQSTRQILSGALLSSQQLVEAEQIIANAQHSAVRDVTRGLQNVNARVNVLIGQTAAPPNFDALTQQIRASQATIVEIQADAQEAVRTASMLDGRASAVSSAEASAMRANSARLKIEANRLLSNETVEIVSLKAEVEACVAKLG